MVDKACKNAIYSDCGENAGNDCEQNNGSSPNLCLNKVASNVFLHGHYMSNRNVAVKLANDSPERRQKRGGVRF